jgi:hypothetical protein
MNVLAWLSAFTAMMQFGKVLFEYLKESNDGCHKTATSKVRQMTTALKKGDVNEVGKLFSDAMAGGVSNDKAG